jgi:hypothetical protein
MSRVNVTVEMAIQHLIAGLRAIPDGFSQVGCSSVKPKLRALYADKMVRWGRQFADTIASLPTHEAVVEVKRYSNTLDNLDPRGWHLGNWAHVARMVAAGQKYILTDGVLCSE